MSVAFIGMYLVVSGSVTMTTIAVIDDGGARLRVKSLPCIASVLYDLLSTLKNRLL